jgi:signal peptidase I
LKDYTPFVINTLQRKGNVYHVRLDQPCPNEQKTFEYLYSIARFENKDFVLVEKNDPWSVTCSREVVNKMIATRLPKIFIGNEFDLYAFKKSELRVEGDENRVILTTKYMGPNIQVEGFSRVLGENEVLTVPWTEVEPFTYQIALSLAEWDHFKLFWESPQTEVTNPFWTTSGDYIVRKKK